MANDPDIARWLIEQDPWISAWAPYLMLGGLVAVGALLAGLRAVFSLSERSVLMAGVGLAGALAVVPLLLMFGEAGQVSVTGDALVVDRRWRPEVRIPLSQMDLDKQHWLNRTRTLSGLSSGMQLRLTGGGRTVWIGATGARVAEAARDSGLPERVANPDAVLAEEDLVSLLSVLEER